MSFSYKDQARLPQIRRAAFMLEDSEGRILVYGFDPGREITVEMENEYSDYYGDTRYGNIYVDTRLTISGISGDPFQHTGPFPAASAAEIESTEQELLSELDRKTLER